MSSMVARGGTYVSNRAWRKRVCHAGGEGQRLMILIQGSEVFLPFVVNCIAGSHIAIAAGVKVRRLDRMHLPRSYHRG